jgi:serine/threonine-protein kinase
LAIFLSLAAVTTWGSWYLRVRLPADQWRRPYEAGRQLMDQGRFGEAERQFAAAVAAAGQLGEHDLRLARSLSDQAQALAAQERFADALPLLAHAIAIHDKALGPRHAHVAPVLEQYAASLRETGQTALAEAALARVRAIRARAAQRNGS